MRKIIAALLCVCAPLGVFAQELGEFTLDGFVRTGFIWKKSEEINKDPKTEVDLGSLDDAGGKQGRIRLNYGYAVKNVGIKGRIQWDDWGHEKQGPDWKYLFGYVNSFDDQLTISMGKLGASPWGTGGPEEWRELEAVDKGGGMRVEYKPNFMYFSGLNVGFVLNTFNGSMDRGISGEVTLADLLRESVLGISYEHDYFLVRFAYRLDSPVDQRPGSFASGREGDDLVYRVEERVLKNYLPGMQIWALGIYEGVGAEDKQCVLSRNWLFAQYEPDWFTAQVRVGYKVVSARSVLSVKPSYYHNFLGKFISVGASFMYENDFGERVNKNAPYTQIEVEPKLQLNFPNAYVAFTYKIMQEYKQPQEKIEQPIERFQTMNLRFGMTF